MIYVDELVGYGSGVYSGKDADQAERVGARNGHQWCHLFSDETDPAYPELHAFAGRVGMRRSWFQGDHYDLTPGRRAAAVGLGAKQASRKESIEIWDRTPRARRWRCTRCGQLTERRVEAPSYCPRCNSR